MWTTEFLSIFQKIKENVHSDPLAPIDVYMANGFFLYSLEYAKIPWLFFMRCLNYRLIKIHRRFTSAYLLCDEAFLSFDCDFVQVQFLCVSHDTILIMIDL
jgi:hypothetical protein